MGAVGLARIIVAPLSIIYELLIVQKKALIGGDEESPEYTNPYTSHYRGCSPAVDSPKNK